MVEPIDSA